MLSLKANHDIYAIIYTKMKSRLLLTVSLIALLASTAHQTKEKKKEI